MRLSSATKPSRLSNTFSVTMDVPSAVASSATASGMKSVAKPGNGSVATSTARSRSSARAHDAVGRRRDLEPHLAELHRDDLDVLEAGAEHGDLTAGDPARHQQRAGLDAVAHDLAVDRHELLDAFDLDRRRPRAEHLARPCG